MPYILIVHPDDAVVCAEVQGILEHAGYTTEVSATAVAYAYAQSMEPDLVLFTALSDLDVRVLELLQEDAPTTDLPVLLYVEEDQRLPPTLPWQTTTLQLPITAVALLAAVRAGIQGEAPNRR